MNRTKKIYFLAAFVMIIGCYALNKSYSLFVATEEQEAVTSKVPTLESSLSMPTITLAGNEECLIKQTINNTSEVAINYSLTSTGTNYEIKLVDDTTNTALGSLESSATKDIYLYLKNTSSNENTITFNINKKYTTLNNDLTTNITNTYTLIAYANPYAYNTELLSYNIINKYVSSDSYTGTIPDNKTYTLDEIKNLFGNNTKVSLPIKSTNTLTLPDPPTKPAEEISTSTENVIAQAQDDYGTSYYYRGNVIDNYVNFAGMCWRIVRIIGDGSIKLILEDQDEECSDTMDGNWDIPTETGGTTKTGNFGYTQYAVKSLTASDGTTNTYVKFLMNYLNGETDKSLSLAYAFKNFQELTSGDNKSLKDKIVEKYNKDITKYLKSGDWCLNDKAYANKNNNSVELTSTEILDRQVKSSPLYYDSYVRLFGKTTKEPTLKCNGTVMTKFADENNTDMYVGTLTTDEIVYSGGKIENNNNTYYILNKYQKNKALYFWTLSPSDFYNGDNDLAFCIGYLGQFFRGQVKDKNSFRPAIILLSSTTISGGDGTKSNAYTIGQN